MAWEEWDQIKAEVTTRQADQMRLNQLAPERGGGGTTPDLASSPAKKQAAVKAINDDLEPGVERDGKHAAVSVSAVVKEFGARDGHGWDTSGALKKAHEAWEKQVKMLRGRLATEKGLLSATAIGLQNNDIDIAGQLAQQSRIDGY
ncbi:hypothetical protein [Streptomyces sp. NPDC000410]|uniref:hypothetical protein n=1 Tax=Streptomyces sp. NPDC000410 TaxID=3154254 RepID=UPI00331D3AEA